MEEIEICANCGKMVPMRMLGETFTCIRCGGHTTMIVPLKDYEKVVQRLQEGKDPFEEPAKNPGKKTKKSPKSKKKKR